MISKGLISVVQVSQKRKVIDEDVINDYMKSCCRPGVVDNGRV
jgi:hypothetical protein